MKNNAAAIEKHLLHYLQENQNSDFPLSTQWFDLISYCLGYYGEVTQEMILVVMRLERNKLLERRS